MRRPQLRGIDDIRVLADQHQALDVRLRELQSHRYLSPAEQTEQRELKKRKLEMKDKIEELRTERSL